MKAAPQVAPPRRRLLPRQQEQPPEPVALGEVLRLRPRLFERHLVVLVNKPEKSRLIDLRRLWFKSFGFMVIFGEFKILKCCGFKWSSTSYA